MQLLVSGLLNVLLVLALLQREHTESARLFSRAARPASSWCQPRPAALEGAANSALPMSVASSPPPPPPSPTAAELLPPAADDSLSTGEARLKRIWRHPPHPSWKEAHDARWAFLDDRQLSRGVSPGDPQRLRCFAEKALSGRVTHLSVLGGSVSFGTTFTTGKSRTLYHWKVYQYLNASFAGAAHEHYQGAVPASGPSYMEHCFQWHLPPPGADLILLEYAVNFDSVEDDAQSFERLLRRLLQLPSQPAIVIVNTMELVPPGGRLPWEPDDGTPYASARDLSFEYRASGAEDAISDLASYYGVPCVSLRGALFSELRANSSRFPIRALYHDRHHPSAWGHSLMAQMVVHAIEGATRHVGTSSRRAAARQGAGACAVTLAEAARRTRLDPPIYSRGEEAPIGACYKDQELAARIHSASGFRYFVEGRSEAKMKPGVVGWKAGDSVRFCLDVSRLARGADFVFILGHLISYEHMGVATISCHDDCECSPVEVDGHVPGGRFSVFKAKTISARRARHAPALPPQGGAACGCKIGVTILPRTGSGEFKFKVLSLMTAAKEGSLRYGHQAGFNNRPTEARFQ